MAVWAVSEQCSIVAGPAFQEFVEPCYSRCERIVAGQLRARDAASGPGSQYDWQFVVCSLDLISGLADGIGPPMAALVTRGQLNTILPQCCKVACLAARNAATSGASLRWPWQITQGAGSEKGLFRCAGLNGRCSAVRQSTFDALP